MKLETLLVHDLTFAIGRARIAAKEAREERDQQQTASAGG